MAKRIELYTETLLRKQEERINKSRTPVVFKRGKEEIKKENGAKHHFRVVRDGTIGN